MPAVIFVVVVLVIVLGVLGIVYSIVESAFLNMWEFTTSLPIPVVIAIGVVIVFVIAVVAVRNESLFEGVLAGIGLCILVSLPILIVPPIIHGRQWHHRFDCIYDGKDGCERGNRCIGRGRGVNEFGFCAAPFGFDYIGMAEFTQGQYRMYLTELMNKECDAIKVRSVNHKSWDRQYECRDSIKEKVEKRFREITAPDRCDYLDLADTAERALRVADEAPMPCISRDEAARVCEFFGGRLPTGDEFRSLFDDREFSCRNTEMAGTEPFKGLQKILKAREIKRLRVDGAGCGRGRFGRACEKHRRGNTDEGLCDVFGNLAEWTSDGGALGGGFRSTAAEMRGEIKGDGPRIDVGFRCVVNGEPLTDTID